MDDLQLKLVVEDHLGPILSCFFFQASDVIPTGIHYSTFTRIVNQKSADLIEFSYSIRDTSCVLKF